MSRARYKNQISLVVKQCVQNYLTYNDRPEEAEFIKWFSERAIYYCNRFTNTICSSAVYNGITEQQVIILVAMEIDKLQTEQVHLSEEEKAAQQITKEVRDA